MPFLTKNLHFLIPHPTGSRVTVLQYFTKKPSSCHIQVMDSFLGNCRKSSQCGGGVGKTTPTPARSSHPSPNAGKSHLQKLDRGRVEDVRGSLNRRGPGLEVQPEKHC